MDNEGPLFAAYPEPLRSDLCFIEAALSYYQGGLASDDVYGAWARVVAALPKAEA